MTNFHDSLEQRSDRLKHLAMTTLISCEDTCLPQNHRVAAAFDTSAEHNSEMGVTTLTRVRAD